MTSIEQLNIVIETLGEEWKSKLDGFLKDETIVLSDEEKTEIIKFLNSCKEEMIEENASNMQEVEALINNDLVYKNICAYIDGQLRPYYAAAALRALVVKDEDKVEKDIKEIFDRAILRYSPQIMQDYEKYGFSNDDSFIEFLNVLDSMCTVIVERNFHIEAIEVFLYANIRLPQKICKQMARIIDKNFESMKLNYIIERMNR